MRDMVLLIAVAVGFAIVATAQVAIVGGLLWRRLWWRAVSAFLLPVLAPIWAFGEGMRVRGVFWVIGIGVYVTALLVTHTYG